MTSTRPGRGPADPERPNRIIDAALSIMLDDGIQGLSHRAVAARARVPLGSTTYYFKDLDALLMASIEKLTEAARLQFEEWGKGFSSIEALPQQLAELIHHRLTRQRDEAILSYELYTFAMRHAAFRVLSESWMGVLKIAVGGYTGEKTAEALVALIDGIMIQGLISPHPPSLERIRSTLKMIVR